MRRFESFHPNSQESSFSLFAGSSHKELAECLAKALGVELGKVKIGCFPDGETEVQILESVRGKQVFVLQSPARNPDHYLVELLILIDALKRASARSIIPVLSYFPYARQDRKDKGRVSIAARLVADLLQTAGVHRILTVDLHAEQIQGFFDVPVDHLYARGYLVRAVKEKLGSDIVVVAPDVGGSRVARRFATELGADLAIVDKTRISSREVKAGALIGSVDQRKVLLLDDMCSTGGTLSMAATLCRKEGATQVYAAVTHALFIGGKLPSGIDRFFVTDSISKGEETQEKIERVSIAEPIAEAIRCVIAGRSISSLFRSEK